MIIALLVAVVVSFLINWGISLWRQVLQVQEDERRDLELRHERDLAEFRRHAAEIADLLTSSPPPATPKKPKRTKGIRYQGDLKTVVDTCMVCRVAMAETEIVYCDTCDLPHHQECWEYVGKCSRYGCEEENSHSRAS